MSRPAPKKGEKTFHMGTKHYAQLKSNKKISGLYFHLLWGQGVMWKPCQ
jgi:hypothetical protein